MTLLLLLLIFHCSDGELELVCYFYGRILRSQKAGELTNKNIPPSLIFIVLMIKSVFVLPCLKAVSCGLHSGLECSAESMVVLKSFITVSCFFIKVVLRMKG